MKFEIRRLSPAESVYQFLLNDQPAGEGWLSASPIKGTDESNIGYRLFPEFRGKGFARAFVSLLVEESQRRGIHELRFVIDSSNPAAIAAAENCGAQRIAERDGKIHLAIANKPPVLVILRGNSGSGKTTLAHKLQKRLGRGTLVISQDVVRRTMLNAADGHGTQAIPLMIDMIRHGRAHCRHVFLEGILVSEWYQPLFEACLKEFNRIHAYYYDIPFEETLRRHATKPNHADFGEADMRRWWREKDLIGIIPEKILTANLSHEDALAMILADIAE